MKSGVILSVALSLVFVLGALWFRFSSSENSPNLIAIENAKINEAAYQELFEGFLGTNASNTPKLDEALTGTDLISRQLMLDYLSLAQSGEATDEELQALADRYIVSLPTLVSYTPFPFANLKVVTNNKVNFQNYANTIKQIYINYVTDLSASSKGFEGKSALESSTIASGMGSSYQRAASALGEMAVPAELAQAHLDLLNVYLKSSAAMSSLARASEDPATSFAGLIVIKENLDDEQKSLSLIENILYENGI